MARETLLSAARRMANEVNISDHHGGLLSTQALRAHVILGKHVELATAQELRAAALVAAGDGAGALALLTEIFDVEDAAARLPDAS
jgi:hypothetical protein